jgi:hypothetical protein
MELSGQSSLENQVAFTPERWRRGGSIGVLSSIPKATYMQTNEPMSNDDATLAIKEVNESLQTFDNLLGSGTAEEQLASADASVIAATSRAQADNYRNKARRQRERGVENMARRHDGVASMVVDVQIRERVVGSAFERYFAIIENGIYVVNKRSAQFIGSDNADVVTDTIIKMVEAMETATETELQQVDISLNVHKEKEDFLIPTYTSPAAAHSVQIRTRLAKRILTVVQKQDELVVKLNQLLWNDEVDPDAIDQVEYKIKKELRGLAMFIQRTLRGMRARVASAEGGAGAGAVSPDEPAAMAA